MKKKATPQPDIGETIVNEFRDLLGGKDSAIMRRLAGAQQSREVTLTADRDRLYASLGAEHPRVQALDTKLLRLRGLRSDLTSAADEQDCASAVGPRQWAVLGRVTSKEGAALAGLQVRLVTSDGSIRRLLKPTTTNANGNFRMVFHVADFAAATDVLFSVLVLDSTGKLVFRSPSRIEPIEGSFASLSIVLSKEALTKGAARERCTATTARGTQCNNTAIGMSPFCSRHGGSTTVF